MDAIYNTIMMARSKLIVETGHDYNVYCYLNDRTNSRDIMLVDNETDTSAVKRISNFISFEDAYEILTTMVKELNKSAVIEPVSELLFVTVDISVNEDEPCIKVGKSVGTGCCREIKIVNTITGDEAIELYKKLVGG